MKIAIASGKGGTGKTTLSVNLADYISRSLSLDVVLADLDVEEPNSGLFLSKELQSEMIAYRAVPEWDETKCTFCGNCAKVCNFNAIARLPKTILVFNELCHSCFACSELCPEAALPMKDSETGKICHYHISSSFQFVEGVLNVGQESAVPLIKQTKEKAEQVSGGNGLILYDAPPGTSCPVIEATKDADFVILVTEPTPFGLHDLKLAVKTMIELGKKMAVVINRYSEDFPELENWCEETELEIIGKIPDMREIAGLYANGNLLYSVEEVQNELQKIVTKLGLLTFRNHV